MNVNTINIDLLFSILLYPYHILTHDPVDKVFYLGLIRKDMIYGLLGITDFINLNYKFYSCSQKNVPDTYGRDDNLVLKHIYIVIINTPNS